MSNSPAKRVHRRRVDDFTVAARLHARDDRLRREKRSLQVYIEHPVVGFFVDIFERKPLTAYACVVHENIDLAKRRFGRPDFTGHAGNLADIVEYGLNLVTVLAHRADRFFEALAIHIGDDQIGAAFSHQDGMAPSYSAAGARNQCNTSFKR